MEKTLITPEGEKLNINTETDMCLYRSPRNDPDTGKPYARGKDGYVHRTETGKLWFYTHRWSTVKGEDDSFATVSEERAKELYHQTAAQVHGTVTEEERTVGEEIWRDIFADV